MSRLLIIDKCSFQKAPCSSLIDFVRGHLVVLPYALCIECLMSEDKSGDQPARDAITLLCRVDVAVKAGAHVGCASSGLFQKEKEFLASAVSVIDEQATLQIRGSIAEFKRDVVSKEADVCRKTFGPLINWLYDFGKTYFQNVVNKGVCKEFRGDSQTLDVERLQMWLQVADASRKSTCESLFSEMSSSIEPTWYTWQLTRLWCAYVMHWAWKRNYSGPSFENRDISNDLYDMEYVAYLSRADGILTGDEKLVEPMARAAFPEKDVFSSLEEVPDSYRCDWAGS